MDRHDLWVIVRYGELDGVKYCTTCIERAAACTCTEETAREEKERVRRLNSKSLVDWVYDSMDF